MTLLRKSLVVTCLGIGTALASVDAQAQDNAYFEAGLAQVTLSTSGVSLKPTDALVRFGYNFTRNFSGEIIGAASVSSDSFMGADFKLDSAYGVYLKGQVEAAPNFELFAKVGWVHATLSGSIPGTGISVSSSDSSFSYGAGLQYLFNKNWYVQGDYASYYDKSGDTIKGPSISVGYRF
jgi:outer membrane autotransporter protein